MKLLRNYSQDSYNERERMKERKKKEKGTGRGII